MNLVVRAEDIMTPRNLLEHRRSDADAAAVASDMGFDAIPISRPDGRVLEFWSQTDQRRVRIRRAHHTAHDSPIESLLRPLGAHVVQFVCYRTEVVGLIDASDLNKPIARIAWLHPMLELERSLLDAARRFKITEEEQARALRKHAKLARKRQTAAKHQDLELPLLEYAQFPHLLRAGQHLGLFESDDSTIEELNDVRKRAAHSGDVVVENREACGRLSRILGIARKMARQIQGLRSRKPRDVV
jgi:hypothetical protein